MKIVFIISLILAIILCLYILFSENIYTIHSVNTIVKTKDHKTVEILIAYETDTNIIINHYISEASKELIEKFYTLDDLYNKQNEIEALLYESTFNKLQKNNSYLHIYSLKIGGLHMKEKCTGKQWDSCRVEKMGCSGCYYENRSDDNSKDTNMSDSLEDKKIIDL